MRRSCFETGPEYVKVSIPERWSLFELAILGTLLMVRDAGTEMSVCGRRCWPTHWTHEARDAG